MKEIIDFIFGYGIGFVIGIGIIVLAGVIWNRIAHYIIKKRVLKAIKALDIEDELANCVAGCNLRCSLAIYKYFVVHGWGNPFVEAFGNLYLCYLIGVLRTEGKIKQLTKEANNGRNDLRRMS